MTPPDDVSRETPAGDVAAGWRAQVRRALGTSAPPVTWRDYQDIVSHARHEYLADVQVARQCREAVSGPAFEQFAAAERLAWDEYHETGRRAWLAYQESQRNQETTPPRATGYEPNFPPAYQANDPDPASHPYPPFRPRPRTGFVDEFDQRQETYLASDPHPESEQ